MRRIPVALEERALTHPAVHVNDGQRGLQIRLSPQDLTAVLQPVAAALVG